MRNIFNRKSSLLNPGNASAGFTMCIISLSMFFVSCGEKPIYEKTIEISKPYWHYSDTLIYQVGITDTTQPCDIVLRIRHREDFAYQNLYVEIKSMLADGEIHSQIVSLNLQDRFGRWEGKCIKGICEADILLIDNIYFRKPGEYSFYIAQYSRSDSLGGIESIRLSVERI